MFSQLENETQPKRSIIRIFGTLIAFGLIIYLVWRNWSGFLEALSSLPLPLLLVVLAFAFSSRLMVTLRWFVLLRLVEPELTFMQVFKLSFVGLFSTNVLPSTIGGDVVKLGGAVQFGTDPAGVTASLIVDRLCGMAAMASLLPFGIIPMFQAQSISTIRLANSPGFFRKVVEKIIKFFEACQISVGIVA